MTFDGSDNSTFQHYCVLDEPFGGLPPFTSSPVANSAFHFSATRFLNAVALLLVLPFPSAVLFRGPALTRQSGGANFSLHIQFDVLVHLTFRLLLVPTRSISVSPTSSH